MAICSPKWIYIYLYLFWQCSVLSFKSMCKDNIDVMPIFVQTNITQYRPNYWLMLKKYAYILVVSLSCIFLLFFCCCCIASLLFLSKSNQECQSIHGICWPIFYQWHTILTWMMKFEGIVDRTKRNTLIGNTINFEQPSRDSPKWHLTSKYTYTHSYNT